MNFFFQSLPPMSLTAGIRYEKMTSAFNGFQGYFAATSDEIRKAVRSALNEKNVPSLINIAINPSADRKAQVNLKFFLFFKSIISNKILNF